MSRKGHPIGDGLLRAVTARLLASVRETDLVARIGGEPIRVIMGWRSTPYSLATGTR